MSQESTNRSFDDLARALAEGSISRRGALKLFAGTAISALIPSRALAQSKMATICHVPPDNPANAHTITVGEAAAQRHLKQHPGDTMGSCQTSTTTSSTTSTSTSTTSTSTTTPMCLQEFGDCTSDDDCCSRICDFGICRGCRSHHGLCSSDEECCEPFVCIGVNCEGCRSIGDPCPTNSACCSGICEGGTCAPACQDENDCPANQCQQATCTNGVCGVENVPDGTPCNDDNACTIDVCEAGVCVSTVIECCGDPCTTDDGCCDGTTCVGDICTP